MLRAYLWSVWLLTAVVSTLPPSVPGPSTQPAVVVPSNPLAGAWRLVRPDASQPEDSGTMAIQIRSDNYFMVAHYDLAGKRFIGASGGTYSVADGKCTDTFEYNTADSARVGASVTFSFTVKGDQLNFLDNQTKEEWVRAEEPPGGTTATGTSPLAGAWRIRAREREGQPVAMPRGPRKTVKILSGSRFQWAAFNTATKQFSGTGGGTYTAADGTYTESIEFFSRDPGRIGTKLSFGYAVKGGDWHHTGSGSTGNPINEVWAKE
ncbi:MAG: membrane or secreted protein [Ferruginibacter sp.]|nr:membrane or secreted protein [Cytophagales bacterium]